jgi:hypothetical protein
MDVPLVDDSAKSRYSTRGTRCGRLFVWATCLRCYLESYPYSMPRWGRLVEPGFSPLWLSLHFSPNQMRPTALMLNIVAASYSTWLFNRGRFVDWAKLYPLLVSSLPTALVGGLIVLDERLYKTVTGLLLRSVATVLAFRKARDRVTDRPTQSWGAIIIGAAVGFVSGACWRWWWGVSPAYPHRDALGVSETDCGPFRTLHIGKFDRRACRYDVCRAGPHRSDLAV